MRCSDAYNFLGLSVLFEFLIVIVKPGLYWYHFDCLFSDRLFYRSFIY